MPTYKYHCSNCSQTREIFQSIKSLDSHKQTCHHCGQVMERKIQGGLTFFKRSPFERGTFEHASWEGQAFRDKGHMKDFCEEKNLRSRYLEDGDVP